MLDYVAVGWVPDYAGKEELLQQHTLTESFYEHVTSGRSVLLRLGQYVIGNQDSAWLALRLPDAEG
jgi:hypothetical protein